MDWLAFLDSVGADYAVGPAQNVRRGRVGINCPRCPGDSKHHFSLDLQTGRVVGCWRDRGHWMPPTQLVAVLAGVSEERARAIVAADGAVATGAGLGSLLDSVRDLGDRRRGRSPSIISMSEGSLSMPEEFRTFQDRPGSREAPFRRYLERRGLGGQIDELAAAHDLRWVSAAGSTWNSRLVFPLRQGRLLRGWTARSIVPGARLRYRAHPPGDAMSGLLWEGRVAGAETVVVVEGPFDALKVEAAAAGTGCAGVALLSNSVGAGKVVRLARVAGRRRVVVLLDRGAEAQAVRVASALAVLGEPAVRFVPEPWKDPGDVPVSALRRLLLDL